MDNSDLGGSTLKHRYYFSAWYSDRSPVIKKDIFNGLIENMGLYVKLNQVDREDRIFLWLNI